jgi:hypothetical protein
MPAVLRHEHVLTAPVSGSKQPMAQALEQPHDPTDHDDRRNGCSDGNGELALNCEFPPVAVSAKGQVVGVVLVRVVLKRHTQRSLLWVRRSRPRFAVPSLGSRGQTTESYDLESERPESPSPLRRCFKLRPSVRPRFAGFVSGCWLLQRRRSGLFPGCPPTNTRPQARAVANST